ncbi:MAG: ABC transporter permease subunit [Sphaerochaeta sp.]|jgi:putative aldouronate transport system permease protein|uniref:ABC transporter permease subunit n=2 Tax=root TaxID=1 RepID=A0ABY4DDS0_9SPIR|nr:MULTISPECIES: ABC transporter permease subunit [Sphaerochaeta]MDT3359082.1 ABC transporter permease subunit [Spirochaetota bacterium]MDD2395890.1 ABC transporter permease subunit [Sphaerochaeta sp.]MDD3424344.1 ABC transporter permease subunit [Sphaerochaeta sp.]MDD4037816.1 ABC transporter permease subunit [Sphaerochaeta sp.]MDD4449523.1 ABC transporter permease subunit [Sphaerochaeta sp.]
MKQGKQLPRKSYFARYWQLYAMMVLPLLYFLVFKYVPMLGSVLAFRRYRPGMGPFGTEWVGLTYFSRFWSDPAFWRAFRNTLVLSILNLVVNFPIPILFAILLNEVHILPFKKVVQTVSYMPRFISTVVVIAILGELLSPSSGIINLLRQHLFGKEALYFMNEARFFRVIYILVDTWQYTGWTAIIYLAAITAIPAELYEAATIDGASRTQQIFFVTIPSIMSTIMVMLIISVGRLLSLGFEKVLLLYTPDNSMVSDIIDTLVYRTGLANQNYSYATAIGLFSGIIGVILVSSSNALSKRLTGEGIY